MKQRTKVAATVGATTAVAATVLLGAKSIAANAADRSESEVPMKDVYPVVFIHGMFGWGAGEGLNHIAPYFGATTGSLTKYLTGLGYACYESSVGPFSSAWDRACELYAQLAGTVVDYGEAHAKQHGHARFGRTYEKPLFEGWGTEKALKIHLIGHSYGGTTARVLAHLLTYGSEAEQTAAGDSVSGLFTGGQEHLISSITAICTPHGGSTAYFVAKEKNLMKPMEQVSYNYAGVVSRTPLNGRLVDFHMEHFGLTNTPGKKDAKKIHDAIEEVLESGDSVKQGLEPEGAAQLNEYLEISPNIYYFSYAYDCTGQNGEGFAKVTPPDCDLPLMRVTAQMIVNERHAAGENTSNDGLVNIFSARSPEDEPSCPFDSEHIRSGIWNEMPIRRGDHGTPIGLLAKKKETHALYEEILANAAKVQ